MEKKLPENLYTKIVNNIFGFWPAWLRDFWCFYLSYVIAVDLTFWLEKYQDTSVLNNFLWLTIFLFYILFKKIQSSAWPHTTIVAGWKYYSLLFIVLVSTATSIIITERERCLHIKIAKTENKPYQSYKDYIISKTSKIIF